MQEGTAALGRLRADLPRDRRADRRRAADLGRLGASAGGGAYSPALTDLIVMTEDAAMFLTGPGVVREALGEEIDATSLGGPRVHDRNGVCHLVERDERPRAARVRELLSICRRLPARALPGRDPVAAASRRSGRGRADRAAARLRRARRRCGGIVDADSLLELCPRWARNVVTTLARIDGRPVGIVANQPRYLGGVLDAEGSEKAARFVNGSATRSGCR